MSRHRRQQRKRARIGRALQQHLRWLQQWVLDDVVRQHGKVSVQSFRWLGVRNGVAHARVEAIAVPSLHWVSVHGTVTV